MRRSFSDYHAGATEPCALATITSLWLLQSPAGPRLTSRNLLTPPCDYQISTA